MIKCGLVDLIYIYFRFIVFFDCKIYDGVILDCELLVELIFLGDLICV